MTSVLAVSGGVDRITDGFDDPVRGIATSGWRGRSFSLGIADAVTVVARTAAMADAAATMVANAVDLAHPGIRRRPACDLHCDSDLGQRLVTVAVPVLTPGDLREIVAIRHNLEGMAARRVGEIATPGMVAEFEALNARFMAAATTAPRDAAQLNREFHFLILRRAGLSYVETICENMWTLMGPFLRTFHEEMPAQRLGASDHQHHRFIDALRANDAEAAQQAMQTDIIWANELVARIEADRIEADRI